MLDGFPFCGGKKCHNRNGNTDHDKEREREGEENLFPRGGGNLLPFGDNRQDTEKVLHRINAEQIDTELRKHLKRIFAENGGYNHACDR